MNRPMIDNHEIEEIMEKLESLEDDEMAVKLLKEFNDATSSYGKLLLNLDQQLDHDEWKRQCDLAKKKVDNITKKIKDL